MSRYPVTALPRGTTHLPTALELAASEREDEIDPELLSLPNPPRGGRTLAVLILGIAAIAAVGMAFVLRHDVVYALANASPATVGDLRTATGAGLQSHENHYVRAEGMLGVAGGIRYERPFVDDTFRTLPVAGRTDVWVDVRVPEGQESGRWEPSRSFTGRLVRFDSAGPRHRALAAAIERATHVPVPAGAWLLVDGEAPESMRWVIVLAGMFLGFAVWNGASIARLVRRVE
jgi:hypothetical protein